MAERQMVAAKVIAGECGVTVRCVLRWAKAGKIDGAYKLNGAWRFDLLKVRRWKGQREGNACPSIVGAKPIGSGFSLPARNTGDRLEQLLGLKP